jgi:acyl-CoA synthetase (AMP-forming)/AMP-acid ligase II
MKSATHRPSSRAVQEGSALRMLDAETLTDMILQRSESRNTWLIVPEDPIRSNAARRLSFEEVYRTSAQIARGLQALGAERGRAVGLVADNSPDFVHLFFGTILAGLVPAPLHLPFFVATWADYIDRVRTVLRDGDAQFLVVGDAFMKLTADLNDDVWISRSAGELALLGSRTPDSKQVFAPAASDDTALIQYSSGSTRLPVGVELLHRNVISNVRAIGNTVGADEGADVALCWLPLFHDMGLTGTMLYSWYWGMPLVLMAPSDFIGRPASWLWAVSRFGVTGCAAPNFAYALCSMKTKVPESLLNGLDLSRWRVAFNGAEPIQESTVDSFTERFSAYGFRPEAMYPVYGLAESVVAGCFPPYGQAPKFDHVDRRSLELGLAKCVAANAGSARSVVSVGNALEGGIVRIVNAEGAVLGERLVGEIELTGASVMKGYYRRPDETTAAFSPDGWFKTGDLGYLAGGEIYVVGRIKDIIKKAGVRFDAADIQARVSEVAGVRAGCVAAFAVENAVGGTEGLTVVAETRLTSGTDLDSVAAEIQKAVAGTFGTHVDVLRLMPPGELAKTSSGKVRVQESRLRFLSGQMQSVWPVLT